MRRFVGLLLSLAVASSLGATAQAPDVLRIGDTAYSIHTNPLEPWLNANPGKLPSGNVTSTGLWRGYIASFVIQDDHLYVEDVHVLASSEEMESVMSTMFGDTAPQLASWFTGHLIIPTGELVDYVHMGYGSTYSKYLVVTVIKGDVKQQRELDADAFQKFRREQYAKYKKTPEYAEARKEAEDGDDDDDEEMTESFLYQYLSGQYLSRVFEEAKP